MLLKSYTKEVFRAKCNPSFESIHCIAHLDEDIREVLPYLNTVLGGFSYTDEPPSLTLRIHGRLITLHPREIAINALEDDVQAEKILQWLKKEINETWERRAEIQPTTGVAPRPQVFEVLKRLPKTNCKECGQPTCMVFATLVADGVKGPEDCPKLDQAGRDSLMDYLRGFPGWLSCRGEFYQESVSGGE
ncbi:MAG: (Fe-S)-binding protein [Thermodesulfobacteriota bacterium]